MQSERQCLLLLLVFTFLIPSVPLVGQQVIASVPVGLHPQAAAVNPTTNLIYVANNCGSGPNCGSVGTVSVIDGTSNTLMTTVAVGYYPNSVAVNSSTNHIYVVNSCGNQACGSDGTVTVIDGTTNNVITTLPLGSHPYGAAVNSGTNKIYVANTCGNDPSCRTLSGTVTVIDDGTLTVAATVPIGANPYAPVVNSVKNKIYIPNACGNDPTCQTNNGTVTVLDGMNNTTESVNVGVSPDAVDVDTVNYKIYVANQCGDDPNCASTATMTMIDGGTLTTTDVPIGGYHPATIGVNSVTHNIYVPANCFGDRSCQGAPNGTVSVIAGGSTTYTSVPTGSKPNAMAINPVTNQIYVANECGNDPSCQSSNGTVTVIDGITLATTNVGVGNDPYSLAVNPAPAPDWRVYVANFLDDTVSVIGPSSPTALQFVPLAQPCRAVDTRPEYGGGGPIQGGTYQSFPIQQEGGCSIPSNAAAYAFNVTLVPLPGQLVGFLTVWPTGESQPNVSIMNSWDGRYKANAAIVPAGTNGAVNVYSSDTTNVVLDVYGYFEPVSGSTLAFYPLTPCRVADTRNPNGELGGPYLVGGAQARDFPVQAASACNIPSNAQAYSLNFTTVPRSGPMWVFSAWPWGQSQPGTSTLNAPTGTVVANAAIVPAGTGGDIAAWASDDTDLIIDIDGYFAPAGTGGLSLYGVLPCRVIDTRTLGTGQPFMGVLNPPVDVADSGCEISSTAQAYVFNATIVPAGAPVWLLTLWPGGESQPYVSTLNSYDGAVTSNMAIVPNNNGSINAYAAGLTQLIMDISSYFAP